MPKKIEDRRIQRTRQGLQDALLALILEKGFDAVTVQDVIDRANVGRSTFYAHFQDKEDLLLSGFEHLRTEFEGFFLGQELTDEGPWALSLSMFQHAENHRDLYKALAGKQGGNIALAHIQKYLYAYLLEHLKEQLPKRKKTISPEVLTHFISSSFISLLTWWLNNDSSYSAAQMNDYFRQLVQPGVNAIMQDG
ncbi:MAG: TetR/AcrR family transcriptional regulator [Anaerolineales bacterium]|nr:TetR/AcrR family transcriptional regulator [Anaerolineales bacterium]